MLTLRNRGGYYTSMASDTRRKRFRTEELLRQAIAGLLERMPGMTGVQITHGTQEYGKDIVFRSTGPMGERTTCACVVKNSKLTGSVSKRSSVREVLFQIEQACDTPFLSDAGDEERVSCVYVMTPYPIGQETIRAIAGKLKTGPKVTFLHGAEVFRLFEKHWPDFLAEEVNARDEEVLSHAAIDLAKDPALEKVAARYHLATDGPIQLDKTYVEPSFHVDILRFSSAQMEAFLPTDLEALASDDVVTRHAEAAPDRLRGLAKHLERVAHWGFLEQGGSQERNVVELVGAYARQIESAVRLHKRDVKQWSLNPTLHSPPRPLEIRALLHKARIGRVWQSVLEGLSSVEDGLRELWKAAGDTLAQPEVNLELIASERTLAMLECVRSLHLEGRAYEKEDTRRVWLGRRFVERSQRHILIVGPPGYGKTSYCRRAALADIGRYREGRSNVLPVYVPLHRLLNVACESFRELLDRGPTTAFVTEKDWRDVTAGNTDLRVYFDGLDEIPDEEKRKKVVDLARRWSEKHPRARCIFTARDFVEGPWTSWLERVSLSGLDAEGQRELQKRWLGDATELERTFARGLVGMPAMNRVMHVPLLATLTLLVFKRTGRLPASRTQLYETFLDLLCGGWDLAKGVMRERVFGRAPTELVITRLAASTHWRRRRNFDRVAVDTAIDETLRRGFVQKGEILVSELIEDGIVVKLANGLQFAHLSFQEFLAAKSLVGELRGPTFRSVLSAFLGGDNWWREAVEFCIGLSGQPHDLCAIALAIQKHGDNWRSKEFIRMVEEQYPDAGVSERFAWHLNDGETPGVTDGHVKA
jgi:hypothetical protein